MTRYMTRYDLTDDNSTLLGNGERIQDGDYLASSVEGEWFLVTPGSGFCGAFVGDAVDGPFRRLKLTAHENTSYETGAQRTKQEGRGRFDLIPYEAMLALARRLEMGSAIYGDRNWEKGMPLSRYLSSLRRHSMQIGYDFSEDHAGAVLFNAAAFVATAERVKAGILPASLDDIGYLARQEPAVASGYLNSMPVQPSK